MLSSRIDRYGDWKNYKDLFQSGKLGSSRPFFEGDNVRERMNQVRKSIVNIRHNWNKFDEFMGDLRVLLEKNCLSSEHDPEPRGYPDFLVIEETGLIDSSQMRGLQIIMMRFACTHLQKATRKFIHL